MSTNTIPPLPPGASSSDKMERKCRQAWYDWYHKVPPQISYKDWRTVWFACLERVGIDSADPEQPSRFDAANAALTLIENDLVPDAVADVRKFFNGVFE